MTELARLDALMTEIAGLVYQSVPMPGWRTVTLYKDNYQEGDIMRRAR